MSAKTEIKRRALKFASLAEVMPEVERLLGGHVTAGQWSLGLICHHLRLGIELSMEGFPKEASWLFRRTLGRVAGWVVLWRGWIPRGVPVPGWKAPETLFDAEREAEELRGTLSRFLDYSGRLAEHPFLGRFSKAQWVRFHCVHCAHHLSFALPVALDALGNSSG